MANTNARYGTLYTKDQISKQLYNYNKDYRGRQVWSDAYATINRDAALASTQLEQQYESDIAQAYLASRRASQEIAGSSLSTGTQALLQNQAQNDLTAAYEKYKANYASNLSQLQEQVTQQTSIVDQALAGQTQNVQNYLNSFVDYVNWLSEKHPEAYMTSHIVDEQELGNPYALDLLSYNPMGATGSSVTSSQLLADLYDEQGNITDRGKDFYRLLAGSMGGKGYSYSDFLNDTNQGDLIEWLESSDTSGTQTNKEMVWNTMLGIDDIRYLPGSIGLELAVDDYAKASDTRKQLGELLDAGRITQDEYDERVNKLYEKTSVDTAWYLEGLGDGGKGDDIDIAIGRTDRGDSKETYDLQVGDSVDDELAKELNYLATGDENKTPYDNSRWWKIKNYNSANELHKNKVIVAYGKMYVYTKKGWKTVKSKQDNVDDAVKAFLKNKK